MKTRTLGQTKIKVSEIGFGGWAIGGDYGHGQYSGFASYGPADDEISRAAITRALEAGVTLFDTADVFGHGHSETLIGEVVDQWPDKTRVKIITKGGINFYRTGEIPEQDFRPYAIANAVQHSRTRLKREKLDIYLLMNPPIEILIDKEYVRKTLESLQSAGHIGAFGVSAGSSEEALEILRTDFPLDVIEFPFSLFDQSALIELLPLAKQRRIGVIARESLANGFLSGQISIHREFAETDMRSSLPIEYRAAMAQVAEQIGSLLSRPGRTLAQAALRFVLDEISVSSVVVGMRTPEQVDENIDAAKKPPLTNEERLAIHHVFFPEDE